MFVKYRHTLRCSGAKQIIMDEGIEDYVDSFT